MYIQTTKLYNLANTGKRDSSINGNVGVTDLQKITLFLCESNSMYFINNLCLVIYNYLN